MQIGSISLLLEIDDSQFEPKAQAAANRVNKILQSIPKVKLTVDDRDLTRAATAFKTAFSGQQTVNLNTAAAQQQLRTLQQQLAGLKTSANINMGGQGSGSGGFHSRGGNYQQQGYYNMAAGAALTATFTAPVVGAGVGIAKVSGDFEEAMQNLIKLTEITRPEMDGLKRSVLGLSEDPRVKAGPRELADALYFVSSTGLKGADAMKVLKASAYGASAGLGTAQVVASTLTSVLDAYGESANQAGRAVDTLTEAVRYGKGEADKYASAFPKVISVASQAGVSFQEVAAQMASATRIGLTPSETATALRQIFNNLIDPSEKSKKAMKSLGTSVDELRAKLRDKGLFNTLKDLSERTGGRIGPITELFGNIRALTGFLATTGTGTLQEYQRTLEGIQAASGTTATAAGVASETFNFQLEKLKSTLERTAITLGTKYLPQLTQLAQTAGEDLPNAIDAVIDAWNETPEGLQKLLQGLGLLVLFAGPIKTVGGAVQVLTTALKTMAGVVGTLKVLESLKGVFTLLRGGMAVTGVASGAAGAGIAGATAGGLVTAAAVGALANAYMAVNIVLDTYKAKIGDAAIATHNAKMAAESMGKSFERSVRFAEGSASATAALKKIQAEAEGAEKDAAKLNSTMGKLEDMRLTIGKNMHLDPSGKALLVREVDRLLMSLKSRQVELGIDPKTAEALRQYERMISRRTPMEAVAAATAAVAAGTAVPSIGNARTAIDKLTDKQLATEKKKWDDAATAGTKLDSEQMLRMEQVFSEHQRRKAQIAENWAAKKRTADDDAANAAKAAQDKADEIANRMRANLVKTEQAQMSVWQKYGNQVEGVLGRVVQLSDAAGMVGEKTARARMQAEMASRAYADIPKPLRDAVVELAGIEYRMKRITDMRDDFRGLFEGMYEAAQKLGISTAPIEAAARAQEMRSQFSKRMGGLYGQAGRVGAPLINRSEAERARLSSSIEALQYAQSEKSEAFVPSGSSPNASIATRGLLSHVAESARRVRKVVPGIQSIGGYRRNAVDPHGHPAGRALDIMVGNSLASRSSLAAGNAVVDFYQRNAKAEGVQYIIWRNRTWKPGRGWGKDMGRPGVTKGHYDHPHVNFQARPGIGRSDINPNTVAGKRVANVPEIAPVAFERPYSMPNAGDFDGRLLRYGRMKDSRPGIFDTSRMGEGESRQFRIMAEEQIQKSLRDGRNMAPVERNMARDLGNRLDIQAQAKQAGDNAAKAIRDMGREIRLIGKENNPVAILMEEWENGAGRFLNKSGRSSLMGMTLLKMRREADQVTDELMNDMRKRRIVLDAVDPSSTEAERERQQFMAQLRVDENNRPDVLKSYGAESSLLKSGDNVGAYRQRLLRNRDIGRRTEAGRDEFDAQRAKAQATEAAAATRQYLSALDSLNQQRAELGANAGKPEALIADAMQIVADRESRYAELRERYSEADARRMAEDYAGRQQRIRSIEREISLERERQAMERETRTATAQAGMVTGAMTPELARQMELEKFRLDYLEKNGANGLAGAMGGKRDNLEALGRLTANTSVAQRLQEIAKAQATLGDENGQAALQWDLLNGALRDADASLKDYLVTAERATVLQRAQLSAFDAVADAQGGLAQGRARNESERMAAQWAVDDAKRAERERLNPGARRLPEEIALEEETRRKLLELSEQGQFDELNRNIAAQFSDSIANGLQEGMGKGFKSGLRSITDMAKQAIYKDIANSITRGIFGGDSVKSEPNILDLLRGRRKGLGGGGTPGINGKYTLPGEGAAPSGGAAGLVASVLGGEVGQAVSDAVDNMTVSNMNVRNMHTGAAAGLLGGNKRGASEAQIASTVIGLFSGRRSTQKASPVSSGGGGRVIQV